MDAKPLRFPDPYPTGASYAVLLAWHVHQWGTRESGDPSLQGVPWRVSELAPLLNINGVTDDSAERNLENWMTEGKAPPRSRQQAKRIIEVLLGSKPEFDAWRTDLELAREAYYERRSNPSKVDTREKSHNSDLEQRRNSKTVEMGFPPSVKVVEAGKRPIYKAKALVSHPRGLDMREIVSIIAHCKNYNAKFYLTNLNTDQNLAVEIANDNLMELWGLCTELNHIVLVQATGGNAVYDVEHVADYIKNLT